MESPEIAASKIVEIGQRLGQKGFIAGADGNISARISTTEVLVTPSGLPKGRLMVSDLVTVGSDGRKLHGTRSASSELLMHLYVYQRRSDISACVHSHPPYTTAFALSKQTLRGDLLPEVVLVVGNIPTIDYAATGTEAVPNSLAPFIEHHDAFILGNHGLLTIGRTLEEAWARHETVEHYAHILHLAMQLGEVRALPSNEIERLQELRVKLFGGVALREKKSLQ